MSDKNASSGIGISGVLFIVFLVLKLTETIDWSWWWVLAPIWIPLTIAICIILFLLILFVLLGVFIMF